MFTKRIFLFFFDRHCRSNTLLRSLNLRLGSSVISFILCYFSQVVKHCFATSEHACPFNSTKLARPKNRLSDVLGALQSFAPIIVRRLGFYDYLKICCENFNLYYWSESSLRNIRHEQILLHFNQPLEFHYLA